MCKQTFAMVWSILYCVSFHSRCPVSSFLLINILLVKYYAGYLWGGSQLAGYVSCFSRALHLVTLLSTRQMTSASLGKFPTETDLRHESKFCFRDLRVFAILTTRISALNQTHWVTFLGGQVFFVYFASDALPSACSQFYDRYVEGRVKCIIVPWDS